MNIDTFINSIKKYKDKLKKYRTCGLENQGEYSDENLVFKVLRRNGYIEKLHDFEAKLVDKRYIDNFKSNDMLLSIIKYIFKYCRREEY